MAGRNKAQKSVLFLWAVTVVFPLGVSTPTASPPAAPAKAEQPVARISAAQDRAVWKQTNVVLAVRPDVQRKGYLAHHHLFVVEGKNSGKEPVTINAYLELHAKPRGGKIQSERCLIYLEIPASKTRTLSLTCVLDGPLAHWGLVIQKVWDFVL